MYIGFENIQRDFLAQFEKEWTKTVLGLGCNQQQLLLGSRLRPQIVLWGHLVHDNAEKPILLADAVNLAVSIELIHKSSLLLDDWIDGDIARHGENAFYIDYGAPKTVMIAMLMVTESLERLSKIALTVNNHYDCLELLIKTARAMAQGAVTELSLDKTTQFDYEINRNIALLETAEIIKNSLLIGYSLTSHEDTELGVMLTKIGELTGFMFQALNDLESFCESNINAQHKGATNYDFTRFRKNLAVARLYQLLSVREQEKFANEPTLQNVIKYFEKYKIDRHMLREMEIVFNEVTNLITSTAKYGASEKWVKGFTSFMLILRDTAMARLLEDPVS
jgi:Geranylgeranyl pyrophosphate synthase